MIKVTCNKHSLPEKQYVLEYLLSKRLGLPYFLEFDDERTGIGFELPNGSIFETSGEFWNAFPDNYLCPEALPKPVTLESHFAPENDLVVLYGNQYLEASEAKVAIGVDLLASIFFMLSRFEECVLSERDSHDRFPAKASISYQYGFLERPVVDEYVEFVWQVFKHLDHSLERKPESFKSLITCDLDWPFDPVRRSWKLTFRKAAGDLLKRRSCKACLQTVVRYVAHAVGANASDSYREAIDWVMEVNEEKDHRVAFYFIPSKTSAFDSIFDMESEEIQALMKEIHRRGHEIGIHPGYDCYNNPENFSASVAVLRKAMKKAGLDASTFGGRMHILRWDTQSTPALWDQNGMSYDSTLSYAEVLGFRCGTCHPFHLYDLKARRVLKTKEIPLITMECTVIAERYEGLGYTNAALARMQRFKEITRKYNGTYCLLWHNSHFGNAGDKEIYLQLL